MGGGDLGHAAPGGRGWGGGLRLRSRLLPPLLRFPVLVPLLPPLPGLRVSPLLLALLQGVWGAAVSAVLSVFRKLREHPLPWVLRHPLTGGRAPPHHTPLRLPEGRPWEPPPPPPPPVVRPLRSA